MSENKYRDTSGRKLTDYPRPSVAVDTAVLALDPEQGLVVLEVRRPTGMGWALPGTFIHEGETLAEAVDRSLRVKANVRGLHPRQLHVFDEPARDDRGWVLSVAHVQVVRQGGWRTASPTRKGSYPIDTPGRLPRDHADIIKLAVEDVRALSRQARSGRTSRRQVHASGIAHCASDRRTAVATRHLPTLMESHLVATVSTSVSGRGACRAFPPIQVINSRTRRHAAGCIAGRPGLPALVGCRPGAEPWFLAARGSAGPH